MRDCEKPSGSCTSSCPSYFTDDCHLVISPDRAQIIAQGKKELPAQLHYSWEWWAQRVKITPGVTALQYVTDFQEQLQW